MGPLVWNDMMCIDYECGEVKILPEPNYHYQYSGRPKILGVFVFEQKSGYQYKIVDNEECQERPENFANIFEKEWIYHRSSKIDAFSDVVQHIESKNETPHHNVT